MRKFLRSIAIVALALASVYGVTSCGKDDNPVDPEPVMLPIDLVEGKLFYDYSAEALELFDIEYVVTDFQGNKETITVTKPGTVEKIYKAKNISDVANVKLTIKAKDVKSVGTGNTFMITLNTYVSLPTHVGGLTIFPDQEGFVPTMYIPYGGYVNEVENKPEYIQAVQYLFEGTYEAKLYLPKEFYNGVSQDWIKEHTK